MAGAGAMSVGLLGGFRVSADGQPSARHPSARQQELVAFVVLNARSAPVARQRVAGSLWPESTDAQALTNLRRELHHLRDGWPELNDLLSAGTRTLQWSDAGGDVDVARFEAAAERGLAGEPDALREAASLYRGDLLPDCTAEWIESDRERLRQRVRAVLATLVEQHEADRAFGDAIEYAQRLCRLDPLDERTWCALMRCHAQRGDRATALHLYQECAALVKKELGIGPGADTRMTYREILALDEGPQVPVVPRLAVYPLVGRQVEWEKLRAAWRTAEAGESRLVVIRGEAGIGKSRLAEELKDWCRLQRIGVATARCYPGEGRLAYAPVAAWLQADVVQTALKHIDPVLGSDVARLRPELLTTRPDVPAPDSRLESWQRLRFFEALAEVFRSAAPLVLVIDDLQWADADTIDWLQFFLRPVDGARCLVVGTVRAEEEQDNRPLGRLLGLLERDDRLTAIPLGPLDRAATAELAAAVAEHALDEAALLRTFDGTEGHPLFIVEWGRMELAGGASHDADRPRVEAVVAARLELLSDKARAAAEVAAAVGRDFQFDILAHASDLEEDELVRALDELWSRHIVRAQADGRWDFSHDRIREVVYRGIGPARTRLIHRRIAQGLELLSVGQLDEVSGAIAVHLVAGGQANRALPFLERAAEVDMRISANEEAIRRLSQALDLLALAPAGRERDARELALRSSLSAALNPVRGYSALEVERNLDRVLQLHADAGSTVPVGWLWVAFTHRFMIGDLKGTRKTSEQALERAATDPSFRCEAHHAMGGALLSAGELDLALEHFDAALAAYDDVGARRSVLGSDLGVFAHAWSSHARWLVGREPDALAHSDRAITLAHRVDDAYSLTIALAYAALLHQIRGDVSRLVPFAEQAAQQCRRYGFAYYGDWANILLGWVAGIERPAEGIETIEAALLRLDGMRARARRPYYLSLLADTWRRAGDLERTRSILDEAIAMAVEHVDAWWLPALYLQRSELDASAGRDDLRRRALALAREQGSRGLEARILAADRTIPRTL